MSEPMNLNEWSLAGTGDRWIEQSQAVAEMAEDEQFRAQAGLAAIEEEELEDDLMDDEGFDEEDGDDERD